MVSVMLYFLYCMCCSVHGSVCLVYCVFDNVCELLSKTIVLLPLGPEKW